MVYTETDQLKFGLKKETKKCCAKKTHFLVLVNTKQANERSVVYNGSRRASFSNTYPLFYRIIPRRLQSSPASITIKLLLRAMQ